MDIQPRVSMEPTRSKSNVLCNVRRLTRLRHLLLAAGRQLEKTNRDGGTSVVHLQMPERFRMAPVLHFENYGSGAWVRMLCQVRSM
jgi:hypothetical protein